MDDNRHRYLQIADTSTVCTEDNHIGNNGVHESLLRSWRILAEVKSLLTRGTPGDVVLDLITLMEGQ